jgi:uncharacterized protein (UPF0332 family)
LIRRFKNTAFRERNQDESEFFSTAKSLLTILVFSAILKWVTLNNEEEVMAHLTPKEILARAEEFLRCADYAVQNNCFNACAICSYASLFWAARAALAYEGFDQSVWEHGELRSNFRDELIKNKGRYPHNFGTWLVNAFALRNVAQYQLGHLKVKEVRRMVYHARVFIKKINEVLNQ